MAIKSDNPKEYFDKEKQYYESVKRLHPLTQQVQTEASCEW
jgi:hypothetical protein